jgi:microcin C transport system substrate-binding protein
MKKHRMDPKSANPLLGPMLETDASPIRRRLVIRPLLPSFLAACLALTPLAAQEASWRHGAALLDEPKYPAGFKHFDYVNPDAPKGGLARRGAQGTFDSFNIVVAGVKGAPEQGLGLIYETLTTSSLDEPNASYGLLAEAFAYPEDYSSVTFRLRPLLLRQCDEGREGG